LPWNLYSALKGSYDDRKVVYRHENEDGPFILTRSHVRSTRIIADPEAPSGWGIEAMSRPGVPGRRGFGPSGKVFGKGSEAEKVRPIRGLAALEALRAILPEVNSNGGMRSTVAEAVQWLESKGGPERMFIDGVKWSGRSDSFQRSWQVGELDKFKGEGFYITDYGKDGKKDQRAAAAKPAASTSDSAAPSRRAQERCPGPQGRGQAGRALHAQGRLTHPASVAPISPRYPASIDSR
jgi:hypothetical protein